MISNKIFLMKFLFLLLVFPALGKVHEVHKVLSSYQKKDSVVMDIKKTFTQPLLNKKTQSSGKLYLAQNLWRLNIIYPQENSLVFNGETLFYVSNSVSHHVPSAQSSILELIFNPQSFEETFKYENKSQKGRTWIHHFKGLKPSSPHQISIQIEKNRILSLHIEWGEARGEEMYQFSSILFNSKINKEIFEAAL